MALTAAEQAELAQLESEVGSTGLSASEAQELAALEAEMGQIDPSKIEAQDVVVNEMPEGLGMSRAVVKNLAGNDEAAFNYLQKKHTDFDFKKDKQGEILAKKKTDKAWGRLDPKGFDWQDITDIGADMLTGVGQGLATAAGGIAGGVASGGLGAIPSAMAASSASGAGLEAIRQGLGTMAGLENNLSGKDIAMSGAVGAISPLMFGTGAAAKEVGKAALKKGLSESATKAATLSQRGLGGKAWDWGTKQVGSRMASMAGGYPKEVIQAAGENLDLIKASEKDPKIAVAMLEEGKDLFVNSLNTARKNTGKQLENVAGEIDKLGASISTKNVLTPLINLRDELATSGLQSESRKEAIASVDDIMSRYFQEDGVTPLALSTKQVQQLRNELKELSISEGLKFQGMGTTKGVNQGTSAMSKDVINALSATADTMKKETDKAVRKVAPQLKDEFDSLNASYAGFKELQDDFYNATKTEEAFKNFLKKQGVTSEAAKKQMSEIAGKDMNKLAAELTAVDIFRKPSWQIPAFGTSNTARTLGLGTVGAALGSGVGHQMGTGTFVPTMIGAGVGTMTASPAMIRKYMTANKALRNLPKSKAAKFMPYTMMNVMDNKEK